MRAQRKHAEDAWQEAQQELEQMREKETQRLVPPEVVVELEGHINQLKVALERSEAQSERDRRAINDQAVKMQSQHETKLGQLQEKYEAKVTQLQQEATRVKKELQRNQELMLWDKATLDTTQTALEQAQANLSGKETAVVRLQAELDAQRAELARLQAQLTQQQALEVSFGKKLEAGEVALAEAHDLVAAKEAEANRLQARLREQETAVPPLQQEIGKLQATIRQLTEKDETDKRQFAQAREQAMLEASELRERVRESRTQLEAQEAENDNYLQQMGQQGERVAEMQAMLIERELALSQLKATAEKQQAFIGRMKEVTSERMNKLNSELGKTREQLKVAIAMVDKLRAK
jgi:chromosome segregation ATPase